MVYRIFVEKKEGLDNEARGLLNEAKNLLGIEGVEKIRLFNRYDAENITKDLFNYAVKTVFSEPQLDNTFTELEMPGAYVFAVEALPGQFDQRADSAAQCIQIISQGERPLIRTAKVYGLYGNLTEAEIIAFKKHVINAVESREAELALPKTLTVEYAAPETVATVTGFIAMDDSQLAATLDEKGLLVEIAYCPAVKHLLKTGREVTPWYRYSTEVVMEVMAEKCGYTFVMDAYDETTGKAQYRFIH